MATNTIQIKRGEDANLVNVNALAGEPIAVTDTERLLIGKGDGTTFEVGIKETSKLTNDAGFITNNASNLTNYDTSDAVDTKISTAINGVNIPENTSDLNNDSNFVDETKLAEELAKVEVPTKTSDLTNDSGFITSTDVDGFATETFVTDKITNLIDGAPEALDTLKEIADKLSDNDDAVAVLTSTIAEKLSITDAAATYVTQTLYDALNTKVEALESAKYDDTEIKASIATNTSAIAVNTTNITNNTAAITQIESDLDDKMDVDATIDGGTF